MTKRGHGRLLHHAPPCPSGKRAYWSRKHAKRALRRAQASTTIRSVYRCTVCGWHHLTSRP